MTISPGLKRYERYERYGWDYEYYSPLTEEEVAWHTMWARRTGGPLLALACGTARLVCRLAEAGFEVVGMDLSNTMLELAGKKVRELAPSIQKRIRLLKADMTDFDFADKFGLVFIADNSFREQKTRRSLLACLKCIRRHLKPGGKLLITERRFDPSIYHNGLRTFGWSEPCPHPKTGQIVSRRGQIRLSKDLRRNRGKFIYKTTLSDGSEIIEECSWSGPLLQKPEYLDLFRRAGFSAKTFVGYEESEDDGQNPILCFVCEASISLTS